MMTKFKKIALWSLGGLVVAAGVAYAVSYQPEIAAVDQIDVKQFSAEQIAKGKRFYDLGDCAVCHTAPGGARNAGGYAFKMPFGTIYTSNITPDKEFGIGRWSFEAFERAMRKGVDREGHYLYPAFPYTAYTHAKDEDLKALYAYLMTQTPVHVAAPTTDVYFPFNIRQGVAAWNWLFLDEGPMPVQTDKSEPWNRGAYLVESFGHCSACHSPRNILFAEKGGQAHLSGGQAEGWVAPSLTATSPSPYRWTQADLVTFMATGFSERHGVANGPMAPVVREGLSRLPEQDLNDIAVYLVSFSEGKQDLPDLAKNYNAAELTARQSSAQGARIFSGACLSCHAQRDGAKLYGVRLPLAQNTDLRLDVPDNAIMVVLNGIQSPAVNDLGTMPAFRNNMNDQQIAALLNYLREHVAGQPAWPDLEKKVAKLRADTAR